MSWRGATLALMTVVLTGCASQMSGVYYAGAMQKLGPPKAGQARIVVFQENPSGVSFEKTACDVKLDGALIGKLPPGTYVYADRPAGQHQIVVTESLFPGETTRDVTLQAGRTYFFASKASSRRNTVTGLGMAGGLAGVVIASAVTSGSDNPGPVDLSPIDEASARLAIAELQLAQ